jgi:hypothetical protein
MNAGFLLKVMLDRQDINLTKNLERIPPNGRVFLPFGKYYFIKKLPPTHIYETHIQMANVLSFK